MYPHYADSTVTTSVEAAVAAIRGRVHHEVLAPFYDHPDYIDSLAKQVRDHLPDHWEHLLMSYHGIPEAHLKNADPTGSFCLQDRSCCLEKKPPPQSSPAHATCYRYQTYATSQALAAALGLQQDQYTISFQSRLGRAPWLTPYTDETLGNLPKRGIKHLVVVCPAFVADNLETLEEINMQGRETFLEAGGETFHTVPCLNAAPHWIANLSKLLQSSATESELFSEA